MANNKVKAILAVSIAMTMAVGAVGCSKPPEHENRAYVVANVEGAAIDTTAAKSDVERAVEANDFVGIVSADGSPSMVGNAGVVGSTSSSTPRRNSENDEWRAAVEQALAGAVADDPECDLLAAIDAARKCFNAESAYPGAPNRIVVFSSGFSTAGAIDMRDGMLFADPHDVIAFYADEMPDLSGVSIEWYNLGSTRAPQDEPTTSTKAVLAQFWECVLVEGCGANEVVFHDVNITVAAGVAASYPAVTAVDLPELEKMQVPEVTRGTTVKLDSQVLYFLPGQAEFIDRDLAVQALRPYADALLADKSLSVSIVGSTASDHDLDYLARLSAERAEAAGKILQDMGVDAGRITCSGEGNWGSDHIYDWADSGETELEPIAAAANRHITLSFS
ncbi:MAG: OmpA family protein [Eggerthellaceae bacterium]|nr:OmpA family protein [Eggerthellaceae bacterium]